MGQLVEGKWVKGDVNPETKTGEYVRQKQKFTSMIEEGGKFPPEAGRYHLYVSYACPWAHRTLIFRKLKELCAFISLSVVSPDMLEDGWAFHENFEGVVPDAVFGSPFLRDIYVQADPKFTGKVTVPVLLDTKLKLIVNNESAEIIRIFNSAFNDLTGNTADYSPLELRSEIDQMNESFYEALNNGVYKCGFARTQEAYDKSISPLFECLERLENHLQGRDYLVGDQLTESDVRLFTTLVRFDPVYSVHFKCNVKMIKDYPNLSLYLSRLLEIPAFRETTHMNHIKRHYYYSHDTINPFRIIPKGPLF